MQNKIINPALANIAVQQNITTSNMRTAITKFSNSIEKLTQGVANDAWSLLLMGEAGQGKTQGVMDTLNASGVKWAGIKGSTSAIGIYRFFYDHRDHDVIVIDDSDAVFESEEAGNILKAAMDTQPERKITWSKQNTNLQSMGIPSEYVMTARVIIITNKDLEYVNGRMSKAQRIMKPVVDRAPMFKTGLPTREWEIEYLSMMFEQSKIICFGERGMTAAEQKEILKFVIDNSDNFNTISFRLLDKICGFYKEMPDTWEDFSLMTLS
jgi:hypothetical protein